MTQSRDQGIMYRIARTHLTIETPLCVIADSQSNCILSRQQSVCQAMKATSSKVVAGVRGDYCYTTVEGTITQVFDGASGAAGGAKRSNDARGVEGAHNNAVLEPDGTLVLRTQSWVPPLDGEAGTWAELMQSEVLWSYGPAYWLAQDAAKLAQEAAGVA